MVGKHKLCYAIPWPKTIVGVDMRCGKCKKHFMTHDPSYVDTLTSEEKIRRDFFIRDNDSCCTCHDQV